MPKIGNLFQFLFLFSLFCVGTRARGTEAGQTEVFGKSEYAKAFGISQGDAKDQLSVRRCLTAWGSHPFGSESTPQFRVIQASVKVLGVGKNIVDNAKTNYPQLVLIQPAVNVLSSTEYRLMNPNGWYCFSSTVTVLASSRITTACASHVASSKDDLAVAGVNEGGEGVTVLGKTAIKREGCP